MLKENNIDALKNRKGDIQSDQREQIEKAPYEKKKESQNISQALMDEKILQSLMLRKKYAERSFRFMMRYVVFATIVLIANGLKII